MNWIRANYDRVAVIAGALFLLLCAFFIWRNASTFEENFATSLSTGPARNAPAPAVELAAAAEKLRKPPQWTFGGRSGLFVPEKHFIGPAGFPATLQTTEVHPPVPNEWLDQFGLPIAEADVLSQDPDSDGYTNLEEWQGRTNPTDKNSHPPFISRLRMTALQREPFRLVFATKTGDTFTINTTDLKEPTQFLQIGDTIGGTQFRIVSYEQKAQPNPATGGELDVSELTLEDTGTKERLKLVKEKVMISPQTVATFVYQGGDRKPFTVKKDEEFQLPVDPSIRYKLVDVQPDKAVIVNTQKPDEQIEVGLLNP
jgi:hypothetical protein